MDTDDRKFYWHANTSSGGTLSLGIDLNGKFSKSEKEQIIADGIRACYESMEQSGFIPFNAQVMSSRDIAEKYGKSRQYWEKLLNEGKILYKETSAGRITTNLWIQGYLDNKPAVDNYVKNVREVISRVATHKKTWGSVQCPVCQADRFEFAINGDTNMNGICRACGFHVHTTPE